MDEIIKDFTDSNFWKFIGLELDEYEEGAVKLKLPVRDDFLNVQGIPHGGVFATLLDTTMGITIRSLGYSKVTTLDMNIHFLKSIKEGTILCKGNVINEGKSTAFVEAIAYDSDDNVLAHSSGTFRVVK